MASDKWAGRRTGSRSSFRVATVPFLSAPTSPLGVLDEPTLLLVSTGWASCAILWLTVGPPKEAPTPVCERSILLLQLSLCWFPLVFAPQNHAGRESENFPTAAHLGMVTCVVN